MNKFLVVNKIYEKVYKQKCNICSALSSSYHIAKVHVVGKSNDQT